MTDLQRVARRQTDLTAFAAIASTAVVIAGLYLMRDVLIPLALAVLVSFVLAPLVAYLRRWGLPQAAAVIGVVTLSVGLMFAIGALGTAQIAQLADRLPEYQSNIREKIRVLRGSATNSVAVTKATSVIEDLGREMSGTRNPSTSPAPSGTAPGRLEQTPIPVEIRQPASDAVQVVIDFLLPILNPLATAGLVILFVVFFLLQREDLRDRLIRLLGTAELHRTTEALDDAAARLSHFFLLQTAINAAFGLVIGLGLWIIGVPSPLLWGIFAMLMRFVPYIGTLLAAAFPVALAAAVDPGWTMLAWTIGLFAVSELIMGQAVETIVFGQNTGLSPVAIVVAATFWMWVWGPIGLILATPLTLCLVVLGQYTKQLEFLHVMFGDQPALTPAESFYQRLLAGDPAEIVEQVGAMLKDGTLAAYYESVALPGLALAQATVSAGELIAERQDVILDGVIEVIDMLSEHQDARTGDDAALPEAAQPAAKPAGPAVVLCVGGRSAIDHAAAGLMAQILDRHAVPAAFDRDLTLRSLQSLADPSAIRVIILTYVGLAHTAQARLAVRRLRRLFPSARVILGLSGFKAKVAARTQLSDMSGADAIATSLQEVVAVVLESVGGALPSERVPTLATTDTRSFVAANLRLQFPDTAAVQA